jgi:glycosyltransferase involved in cell wall biosynthesis
VFENKSIGVVVPAFNEERLIGRVLETMPPMVDRVIVVDDASTDSTPQVVESYAQRDARILLLRHAVNQGVGGAIAAGYARAVEDGVDIVVVMAGDAQMDPADLPELVRPVARGEVDYAKGNRLFSGESWHMIPHYRYLGNALLSLLTKIASGYWHIADSQTGYAAISAEALRRLDLNGIYKRYGMPNDLLIKLNCVNARVRDIPVRPVYDIGEKSGIRLRKVIPTLSLLLLKGFFVRLVRKYVILDFHPLVFFYTLGLLITPVGLLLGLILFFYRLLGYGVAVTSALFAAFLVISGFQLLFFAMWFDMEYNKELR